MAALTICAHRDDCFGVIDARRLPAASYQMPFAVTGFLQRNEEENFNANPQIISLAAVINFCAYWQLIWMSKWLEASRLAWQIPINPQGDCAAGSRCTASLVFSGARIQSLAL